MNSNSISAVQFFKAWKLACDNRKPKLLEAWDKKKSYTSEIIHVDKAVIADVARELGLDVFSNYYCLDAVFVRKQDRVHCAPTNQNWFHNIQIAFEHENSFGSGLFQEVSHLLITRANLRMLVSYPENNDLDAELRVLEKIITESELGKMDASFLFIIGKRIETNGLKTGINWQAYTYQNNAFCQLKE